MMSESAIGKHKQAMLEALEKTLGVVTSAAKMVGINRTTHYQWMENDAEYKAAVAECGEVALDYAETQLHKQIGEGQPASTIFYLKTKGKKRGYIERTELSGTITQKIIQVEYSDNIPQNTYTTPGAEASTE